MSVLTTAHADTFRRHRFRAMAVAIELLLETEDEPEEAFAAAERELRRLESVFSRFDPASELSRLNREGRRRCSEELRTVLDLALRAPGEGR